MLNSPSINFFLIKFLLNLRISHFLTKKSERILSPSKAEFFKYI